MVQLFYELFISNDMLGYLMQYESTEIICRYAAIFCTFGLYALIVIALLKICKYFIEL